MTHFSSIWRCVLLVGPLALAACGAGNAQVQSDLVEVRKELRDLNEAYKAQSRRLNSMQAQLSLMEDRVEGQRYQQQAAQKQRRAPVAPVAPAPPTPELPPATITQADLDAMGGAKPPARRSKAVRKPVTPPTNAKNAGNIGVHRVAKAPAVGGPNGDKDDPIHIFNRARDRLRSGDVPGGIEALRRFAAMAPNHSYADNALTLVGHAQFDRAQFAAALQTFRTVLERFPTGNRVPDALLMTGLSLKKLGRVAEGRDTLGRLRAIYPNSAAAKRAADELARAQGRM